MRMPALRSLAALGVTALLGAGLAAPAGTADAAVAAGRVTSSPLALPAGFQPEGIAVANDPRPSGADPTKARTRDVAYLGSRADGDVVRLDLSTGRVKVISQGPGTPSLGLKVDGRDRIFVAGGSGGDARVLDARTGKVKASYDLVQGTAFINDVVLVDGAAWFTDSANAQLFKLPLTGRSGRLPKAADVVRLPLTGAWQQVAGNNANGITATPDGKALLVVNSSSGLLYRVNTKSGAASVVDLGGTSLEAGDGLLLEGRTLYAVQNRLNTIAVLKLAKDGRSGRLEKVITSAAFDVPTTLARSGNRLLAPNARFTTPPTPTTAYDVTSVRERLGRTFSQTAQRTSLE